MCPCSENSCTTDMALLRSANFREAPSAINITLLRSGDMSLEIGSEAGEPKRAVQALKLNSSIGIQKEGNMSATVKRERHLSSHGPASAGTSFPLGATVLPEGV